MFNVDGLDIEMYEGDFGEKLPINITQGEILEGDVLKFIIQTSEHKEVLAKDMEVNENSFNFSLNKEQTSLLKAGTYLWGLKQYRDELLIDTLTANNKFKVIRGQ